MVKYRRYRNALEMWLSSNKGKRILNLLYSWGAAFVILGALFKLLHLPYGNEILFVSMMTEFFVFFVSGFEQPEKAYHWEEVFPELNSKNPIDRDEMEARRQYLIEKAKLSGATEHTQPCRDTTMASLQGVLPEDELLRLNEGIASLSEAVAQLARIGQVSGDMMSSYQDMMADYETLNKGSKEYLVQMEHLARNVAGLNTIYEIQLKGISSQIDAIDRINAGLHSIKNMYDSTVVDSTTFRAENERMALQLAQLNQAYARMLEALTINMGMPGSPHTPYQSTTQA